MSKRYDMVQYCSFVARHWKFVRATKTYPNSVFTWHKQQHWQLGRCSSMFTTYLVAYLLENFLTYVFALYFCTVSSRLSDLMKTNLQAWTKQPGVVSLSWNYLHGYHIQDSLASTAPSRELKRWLALEISNLRRFGSKYFVVLSLAQILSWIKNVSLLQNVQEIPALENVGNGSCRL